MHNWRTIYRSIAQNYYKIIREIQDITINRANNEPDTGLVAETGRCTHCFLSRNVWVRQTVFLWFHSNLLSMHDVSEAWRVVAMLELAAFPKATHKLQQILACYLARQKTQQHHLTDRARRCSVNALDMSPGDVRFESWPGHRLFWQFHAFPQSFHANDMVIAQLGTTVSCHILTNSSYSESR
jgi:hypothetical protein